MNKTIAYTRASDGGLSLCYPTPNMLKALTHGGFGKLPGDAVTSDLDTETKRVEVSREMPRARAIDNMVRAGHDADFAAKWCDAIMVGGETDASALDMIRIKSARDGDDHAAIEVSEVPADRFLRDAWRKAKGKIGIYFDINPGRLIFAKAVIAGKNQAAKQLTDQIEAALVSGSADAKAEAAYEALLKMDLRALGQRVLKASSYAELKALWPQDLPR